MNNVVYANIINSGFENGGGIQCSNGSTVNIENTVFWMNYSGGGHSEIANWSSLSISHSVVEGGLAYVYESSGSTLDWGAEMIDEDPAFVDPGMVDFHLTWLSPCINRGTMDHSPVVDPEMDPRPIMGAPDIGVDEFVGTHALEADLFTLSVATGGSIDFKLDAGSGNSGRNYMMLGSVSGTVPGWALPGGYVTLPTTPDWFTNLTLAYANTPLFDRFLGTLDALGQSTAQLNTGGPLPPEAVGLSMYFAFCLNNPFNFVSTPVIVEIVPPN
ncbi:MAG: hypothetical protein ABIK28_06695 [Planctomycetota bacterium]